MNYYLQRFKSAKQRLLEKIDINEGDCWIWTAGRGRGDYGKFWYGNKSIAAHVASWAIFKGPIPDGLLVCHSCDIPSCVNPAHLFLGTAKDNTQDMIRKGRDKKCRESRRGVRSNFAKLNESEAVEIFKTPGKQRDIGARFGISQTAVSLIKRRVNWGWLTSATV